MILLQKGRLSYKSTLITDLRDKLDDDDFILPDMTSLTTKQSQLHALRIVKEAAAASFVKLEAEKKRFLSMMGHQHTPRTTISQYATSAEAPMSSDIAQPGGTGNYPSTAGSINNINYQQHNNSLAETTIKQHTSSNDNPNSNPYNLPFKILQDGLSYAYRHDDPSVLSDYPITFRGCYGCGETSHWRFKQDCKLATDKEAKNKFWKNLWINRPHTKKRIDSTKNLSKYQSSPALHTTSTLPPSPTNPPPTAPDSRQGLGRGIDANRPAWMTNPDKVRFRDEPDDAIPNQKIKRELPASPEARLWITSASLLQHSHNNPIRPMPLDLDNGLPGVVIRFATPSNIESTAPAFLCHLDSCAGMNTGNLTIHQYIITKHPSIVAEYIQFDDNNPFDPIRLECAVPQLALADEKQGCLTAIVRYFTKYTHKDGKPVILSFGLGKDVTVNAIIGLPTLRQWGGDIILSKNTFIAQNLNTEFPLDFKSANNFICPPEFIPTRDFIRPPSIAQVRMQCDNIPNDTILDNATVIDSTISGVLQRRVTYADA